MNEQLQQALAAMLNKTVSGVEAGAAFLQSEIPDVIQQLLMWKLASSVFEFFVWLIVSVLIFTFLKSKWVGRGEVADAKYSSYSETFTHDSTGSVGGQVVPTAFVLFIASMSCFFGMWFSLSTAIQIWLAPKIYLIEYAASLAN